MMRTFLARLIQDDHGQDLIEYGLLAAFISLVAIAAITSVGTSLQSTYTTFSSTISGS